jgi:deoxyribodipyrimidine photo-lyase
MWFRRDLRLHDNPALLAATADGATAVPLFVVDPALWKPAGAARRAYLARALAQLRGATHGALVCRYGDPVREVVAAARAAHAAAVQVAADYGPYGRRRDEQVARALAEYGIELVRTGSPYAVAPGRVRKSDGSPYRVFTPFSRAWAAHGWRRPASSATGSHFSRAGLAAGELPTAPVPAGVRLPDAGEHAALARWAAFRESGLDEYADQRDRPDLDATSRLSVHLKYGELHPRTLLADLAEHTGSGPDTYRNELCWREFYADVLFRRPDSARQAYRPELAGMQLDGGRDADQRFTAWAAGRTGYPIVDAAMRQLRDEGWMHNRMRMVAASFLVKDLHLDWTRGARHFLAHLVDADLASNNHGWQWMAGTGTDAAPYFRIFNPISQGKKFDPAGEYVRRYVPELRTVPGREVHEPWTLPGGLPEGYPDRIVDHAAERDEALRRYQVARG